MFDVVGRMAGAFVIAVLMTGFVRHYAIHRSLLDSPNQRSSHSIPMPRGGGLASACAFFLILGLILAEGEIVPATTMAVLAGALVALVGWVDDHGHVSPRWRLLAHVVAAGWAVYWLGGVSTIVIGDLTLEIGWIGIVVSIAGIVWMINLFNFMDGIDGLAGSQAVMSAFAGGTALLYAGRTDLGVVAWVLAAAVAGFLVWNWPPAKIFMGDVGSGFIGFILGVVALAGIAAGAVPFSIWLILLALFVGDATYTLVRRVAGGERWYEAHRSHAYQRLTDLGWSHRKVTILFLLLNLLCLWPLAWAAWCWPAASPYIAGAVMGAVWLGWKKIHTLHKIRHSSAEPLN